MKYELITTCIFDDWLFSIKDTVFRARIIKRFDLIESGNFGDHKIIGNRLWELRFFFGSGYRVYYTVKNNQVVFLLCGGDKSSQRKDIKQAKSILDALEKT